MCGPLPEFLGPECGMDPSPSHYWRGGPYGGAYKTLIGPRSMPAGGVCEPIYFPYARVSTGADRVSHYCECRKERGKRRTV